MAALFRDRVRVFTLKEGRHGIVELLLIVGGDTAIHTLQRMGIHELQIMDELLPGMSLAQVQRNGKPLYVVLKSGNHGEPDTLWRLIDQLRRP